MAAVTTALFLAQVGSSLYARKKAREASFRAEQARRQALDIKYRRQLTSNSLQAEAKRDALSSRRVSVDTNRQQVEAQTALTNENIELQEQIARINRNIEAEQYDFAINTVGQRNRTSDFFNRQDYLTGVTSSQVIAENRREQADTRNVGNIISAGVSAYPNYKLENRKV